MCNVNFPTVYYTPFCFYKNVKIPPTRVCQSDLYSKYQLFDVRTDIINGFFLQYFTLFSLEWHFLKNVVTKFDFDTYNSGKVW